MCKERPNFNEKAIKQKQNYVLDKSQAYVIKKKTYVNMQIKVGFKSVNIK